MVSPEFPDECQKVLGRGSEPAGRLVAIPLQRDPNFPSLIAKDNFAQPYITSGREDCGQIGRDSSNQVRTICFQNANFGHKRDSFFSDKNIRCALFYYHKK